MASLTPIVSQYEAGRPIMTNAAERVEVRAPIRSSVFIPGTGVSSAQGCRERKALPGDLLRPGGWICLDAGQGME